MFCETAMHPRGYGLSRSLLRQASVLGSMGQHPQVCQQISAKLPERPPC